MALSLRSDTIRFEERWPAIEEVVSNILQPSHENIGNERWQETFFDVYKICIAQPESLTDKLYSRLKNHLKDHIKEIWRVSLEKMCSDMNPN